MNIQVTLQSTRIKITEPLISDIYSAYTLLIRIKHSQAQIDDIHSLIHLPFLL